MAQTPFDSDLLLALVILLQKEKMLHIFVFEPFSVLSSRKSSYHDYSKCDGSRADEACRLQFGALYIR